MKGFKFKLQSVLDAKKKKFEDSQLEFAKVKIRLNNENQRLDFMYKYLEETTEGLEGILRTGNIDYTLIFCHQNYILKLKTDIKKQHSVIKKVEKELEEKSNLMLEAMKEKTMMEKLREKALDEFKKNFERLDSLNIDEIATNRHKRVG